MTGAAVFDRTRGLGRCFFSGRNLMNFDLLRPCGECLAHTPHTPYTHTHTHTHTHTDGGLPTSEGDDSYCMAGTSAAVNEEEVYLHVHVEYMITYNKMCVTPEKKCNPVQRCFYMYTCTCTCMYMCISV